VGVKYIPEQKLSTLQKMHQIEIRNDKNYKNKIDSHLLTGSFLNLMKLGNHPFKTLHFCCGLAG